MCRRRALTLALLLALSCLLAPLAWAQSPAVQYAYDELGRLVAVVDPQGNTALYLYDAVGNLLAIQRVDAGALAAPVVITAVVPERGKTGTAVSVLGRGFAASPGQNLVSFNGTPATVTQAAANRLVTTVPSGATTGPITVAAPPGFAVSPQPFRVLGALAVAPTSATLVVGGTQAFVATEDGAATVHVVWAVDGIVGGNADVGTISATGVYTAPAAIAVSRTVTISATSRDDPSTVATALVSVRELVPAFLAATPLSVQVADAEPRLFAAPALTVQLSGGTVTTIAGLVGVQPVSADAFATAPPVSVTTEPLSASVSPTAADARSPRAAGLVDAIDVDLELNHLTEDGALAADVAAEAREE